VIAATYAEHLEANRIDVYERRRSGRSTALPVKRTWLDKEDGSQRPIGMPAFEDTSVQRAGTMLWGAVDAQDVHDGSHGFREGHSPHQALQEVREPCMELNIGWIVEADVSGCFDNLDHGLVRDGIRKRVKDGGIRRLIGTWRHAGVLEGEQVTYPEQGTPQGGVRSPMVANIFLHEVLDAWDERDVRPRMNGRTFLLRCADDCVIGCEREADARRIMAVLPKRVARVGLTMHPTKTGLVACRKPGSHGESDTGNGTGECLGLTHDWTKSRRGSWVIKRNTASKRLRRTMKARWRWCRDQRHTPLTGQHRIVCQKRRGHDQYDGIRGHDPRLQQLYEHAGHAWRYWLSRRRQKSALPWETFDRLHGRFPLPAPSIIHAI
jgi:group II intron reverse transcriptase/maturase